MSWEFPACVFSEPDDLCKMESEMEDISFADIMLSDGE